MPHAPRDFPVIEPSTAHTLIAQTCINYLTSGCFKEWEVEQRIKDISEHYHLAPRQYRPKHKEFLLRFHFLQYAAQSWWIHAGNVRKSNLSLFPSLDVFLRHGCHDFESWKDFWLGLKSAIPENLTPLHIASHCGLATYCAYLLAHGEGPNVADAFGQTPLSYASMQGHQDAVSILLKHGARHNDIDCSGLEPIHHAAKMNRTAVLRVLLHAGADPMAIKSKEDPNFELAHNQNSTLGQTALYYARRFGHVDSVLELQKYIDPGHLTQGPLHWAADMGRVEVVLALLKEEQVRIKINEKDLSGNTPLFLAARARDAPTVRTLLAHGADVHARSDDKSTNPRLILKMKPRTQQPTLGYTPLHSWARMTGSYDHGLDRSEGDLKDVLEILVEYGCDIDARDGTGRTALFAWKWAGGFRRSFADIFVSLLLKYGANASSTDIDGSMPLHHVSRHPGDANVVRLLVNAGADINAVRGSDGQTPLITTTKERQLMDPTMFHDFGADFNRKTFKEILLYTTHATHGVWNFLMQRNGYRMRIQRSRILPEEPLLLTLHGETVGKEELILSV